MVEDYEDKATLTPTELANSKTPKETALQLVGLGFIVVPSTPCGRSDRNDWSKPGKSPVGAWKDKTKKSYCVCTTREDVERQWALHPNANVGVVCGGESGVYCLDIDRKEKDGKMIDGFKTLRDLGHDLEKDVPPTIVSKTPSGGWHVYFKCSGERKIWEATPFLHEDSGLDIRGEKSSGGIGGFAVEAPSSYCLPSKNDLEQIKEAKAKEIKNDPPHSIPLHGEIRHYQWIHAPGEYEIMECPDWLLDLAEKAKETKSKADAKLIQGNTMKQGRLEAFLRGVPPTINISQAEKRRRASLYLAKCDPAIDGQHGHNTTFRNAIKIVVGFDLDDATAYDLLANEYNPRCSPPWSEVELRHKIEDARKEAKDPPGFLLNAQRPQVATATKSATADAGDGATQDEAVDLPRFGYPLVNGDEETPTVEGALRLASGREIRLKVTARGGISLCRAIETCLTQARQGSLQGEGSNRCETFDFKKDAAPVTHLATVLWMRSRGRLFYHAKTKARSDIYFFDNVVGRLIVMASDEFSSWLANETRIIREDKAFKRLLSFVQDAAMPSDVSAGVIPREYFAKKDGKLYISNGESYMVRCSPGNAEQVKNGTDDVLFLAEKTLLPWPFRDRDTGLDPFDALEIFAKASYSARYGRELLRLHYLNIFACHDTRPPLLLTGDKGAGKTKIAKGLMSVIGTPIRINGLDKKREDDFAVMMDNGGLLCLDNIEGEIVKAEWFESAIERVATEGGMETTEKYTHKLHTYQTRANLIITSKHPIFADNDGLTDRLIIIRMEVRDETKDAALFREIEEKRGACLTWTAWKLADILAADEVKADETINKRHPDFGAFSLKAGKVLGRYDAVLDALTSGEFDKTLLAIQMNPLAADILDAILCHEGGNWTASATEIAQFICERSGACADAGDLRELAKNIGLTLKRLVCLFRVCFPDYKVTHPGGITTHVFKGANPRLKKPEEGLEA